MNVDRGAQLRETPGGAPMIEMDVAEKNVPDIARAGTETAQFRGDVLESRFRSGIEKDRAFVGLEQSRGDDAGPVEMLGIENVDHVERSLRASSLITAWFEARVRIFR